ncbi:hypothetical protein [Streptomyces hirsutus]|uniref:hypothetical protein n=1 Tax=Streptomyces hirsutus TaxID=35620 RepID=UPI0012FF25EB|nr:hypothetical protein [Streptomyces hirsutus]
MKHQDQKTAAAHDLLAIGGIPTEEAMVRMGVGVELGVGVDPVGHRCCRTASGGA